MHNFSTSNTINTVHSRTSYHKFACIENYDKRAVFGARNLIIVPAVRDTTTHQYTSPQDWRHSLTAYCRPLIRTHKHGRKRYMHTRIREAGAGCATCDRSMLPNFYPHHHHHHQSGFWWPWCCAVLLLLMTHTQHPPQIRQFYFHYIIIHTVAVRHDAPRLARVWVSSYMLSGTRERANSHTHHHCHGHSGRDTHARQSLAEMRMVLAQHTTQHTLSTHKCAVFMFTIYKQTHAPSHTHSLSLSLSYTRAHTPTGLRAPGRCASSTPPRSVKHGSTVFTVHRNTIKPCSGHTYTRIYFLHTYILMRLYTQCFVCVCVCGSNMNGGGGMCVERWSLLSHARPPAPVWHTDKKIYTIATAQQ